MAPIGEKGCTAVAPYPKFRRILRLIAKRRPVSLTIKGKSMGAHRWLACYCTSTVRPRA